MKRVFVASIISWLILVTHNLANDFNQKHSESIWKHYEFKINCQYKVSKFQLSSFCRVQSVLLPYLKMAYTSYILPTWAAKTAFCNIGLISNIDSLLSSKLAQASLRFKGFVPHSNKTYSYHVFCILKKQVAVAFLA